MKNYSAKTELKDLGNFSLSLFQEMRKHILQKALLAKQTFDKEISMGVTHRFNQLPQQENCQFVLTGKKMRQSEAKLSDFLDFIGQDDKMIQLDICVILQEKGRVTMKVIQKSSRPLAFNRDKSCEYGTHTLQSHSVGGAWQRVRVWVGRTQGAAA